MTPQERTLMKGLVEKYDELEGKAFELDEALTLLSLSTAPYFVRIAADTSNKDAIVFYSSDLPGLDDVLIVCLKLRMQDLEQEMATLGEAVA